MEGGKNQGCEEMGYSTSAVWPEFSGFQSLSISYLHVDAVIRRLIDCEEVALADYLQKEVYSVSESGQFTALCRNNVCLTKSLVGFQSDEAPGLDDSEVLFVGVSHVFPFSFTSP